MEGLSSFSEDEIAVRYVGVMRNSAVAIHSLQCARKSNLGEVDQLRSVIVNLYAQVRSMECREFSERYMVNSIKQKEVRGKNGNVSEMQK